MIASAKQGDKVWIRLTNGTTKIVKLGEVKKDGVEGYDTFMKDLVLTFYPFHNILYIRKHVD